MANDTNPMDESIKSNDLSPLTPENITDSESVAETIKEEAPVETVSPTITTTTDEPAIPKSNVLETPPPIELSSDAKCKPSLSLILFVLFIGIITFILGFLVSNLITTNNIDIPFLAFLGTNESTDEDENDSDLVLTTIEPTSTLSPTIIDDGWVEYINDEMNFKFSYPEDWDIITNSNTLNTTFIVTGVDYSLSINIMEGWGPEVCVYEDTTADLTDLFYFEYGDYIEIQGVDMIYRRSYQDGAYKICAREIDSDSDLFSDLAFRWTSDDDTFLSGSVSYIVLEDDIDEDMILVLDRILASLEGI